MECQDLRARKRPNTNKIQSLDAPCPTPSPGLGSGSDPFIVATSHDSIKPNAGARKFIRQHVMKGKNKIKKKNRKRTTLQQSVSIGSWINQEPGCLTTSPLAVREQRELLISAQAPSPSPPPIESVNALGCTGDIGPYLDETVHKFVSVMRAAMYPIESCVDLSGEDQRWADELKRDPTYLQTVSHIAQSYFDVVRSQPSGPSTIARTNKAIVMLQQKFSEADLVVTDSVIFTVLALAMMSQSNDDLKTAEKHIHGLHQLIELRGGLKALGEKRLLQIKCCRIDLGFALKNGSRPLFLAGSDISWKPYLVDPRKPSTSTVATSVPDITDIRLMNVFLDLRELTTALNLAHQTQRKLPADIFQEAVISVQYRLQNLSYETRDKQEVLRVAMLAYSTSLFLDTDGSCLHLQYRPLTERLREVHQLLFQESSDESMRLTLWLIYVSKVSVLDAADDCAWLRGHLLKTNRLLGLRTWRETRLVLKSLIWVDVVSDKAGKCFFDACHETITL